MHTRSRHTRIGYLISNVDAKCTVPNQAYYLVKLFTVPYCNPTFLLLDQVRLKLGTNTLLQRIWLCNRPASSV